jgi:hypothetical protein
MTPINLKHREAIVPCGKCPQCTARKVSAWSFRLMQEEKRSDSALFITLTYADAHLHFSDQNLPQLQKRDLQLFVKRLRKLHTVESKPLKYYAVGEYGSRTWRPHYHLLLFNCQVELIQKAWHLGQVHYGTLTPASVGYTLKYLSKPKPSKYSLRGRTQQFALMSKRLGDNYLTDQAKAWHKADLENRSYVPLLDGKIASMPRYYQDKLYTKDERTKIQHHAEIQRNKQHEIFMKDFDKNYARLQAQQKLLKQNNYSTFTIKNSLL